MYNFNNPNAAATLAQRPAIDPNHPLAAFLAATEMFGGGNYIDPATGKLVQQVNNQGQGEDGVTGRAEGHVMYTPRAEGGYHEFGDSYDWYNTDGRYDHSANFKDPNTKLDTYGPLIVGGMAGLGALAGGAIGGGTSALGSGAGFVGEGALSGIGAWDAALASAPSWSGAAAGAGTGFLGDVTAGGYGGLDAAGAAGMGGGGSLSGGAGAAGAAGGNSWLGSLQKGLGSIPGLGGGGGGSNWLGLASTALGALGGAQGQDASTSSTRAMDPRMDSLFYGDLAPRAQQTMAGQMPLANGAGTQMMQVGSGLLGKTAPDTATNPYATGILNDMQRRQGELIDQRLQGVRGNFVGSGGLGGSRQGVAEAQAISQGADNFAGQGLNFMGGLYNQDQNRLLQQQTLGAGLLSQGLNTQFQPLKNTADIYAPFTGFGTTTNNQQSGGGWQGALGGALGAAQFSKNMGLFGNNGTTGGWW